MKTLYCDFVEIVVSFEIVLSPFTLQAHHSLHHIHGPQMDMALETFFWVHDEGGFRKAYIEEWEQVPLIAVLTL